jgi:hypothetical protein
MWDGTFCCRRLCVLAGCRFQIFERLLRVFSVSNQIVRPIIIVMSALTTTR